MRLSIEQFLTYKAKNKKIDEKGKKEYLPDNEPEKNLDIKIKKYLKDNGYYGFHDKSHGINEAGHPDWIIALPNGIAIWIENKSKSGRFSKEQKDVMLMLTALKQRFYECRSFEQFLNIINKNIKMD